MALISLHSLEETAKVARALKKNLLEVGCVPIFMLGDLGAGKTTFTSFLVNSLPGAEQAEIGSPSFNLCNLYPTQPPVLHCDLYRCHGDLPEEIENALQDEDKIIIVEWANWLSEKYFPDSFLTFQFYMKKDAHFLKASAFGKKAVKILEFSLNDLKLLNNNKGNNFIS